MKKLSILMAFSALIFLTNAHAQVKVGNNPNSIDANSILELESTNKGFLPPRVIINDLNSVSPLTGTVPAGMLVYSSGGAVTDGFYFWNGTSWTTVGEGNMVTKSSSQTLTKAETFVLANNNIVLTLPVVTAANNGLSITIKNIGTHTHLIKVKGNGSTTIDGKDTSFLTRWVGRTFVAYNGNWVTKEKEAQEENVLKVSTTGSWTTITEALEYLAIHMNGPAVIKLSGGSFPISSTQVIDLDFPLTIQGASYANALIEAADGLGSTPMFQCKSECYFKMLSFDATTLSGYGNVAGQDAIWFETDKEYYEVKDCSFDGFNKTLVQKTNVELWVFEVDIKNAKASGIEVDVANVLKKYATLKVSEVDFISCAIGINMLSADSAIVSILNSTFYNASGGTGINYVPVSFKVFSSIFITNNAWNSIGTFFNGFDFTLISGRDARAFIQNNAGDPDRNPSCHFSVGGNAFTTALTAANTWYKANFALNATAFSTTKWTIDNTVTGTAATTNMNKIVYQPVNKRSGYFFISGNLSCTGNNKIVSICVVKNGATASRLGETSIRTPGNAGTPALFTTIVYLPQISKDDYFEIYLSDSGGGLTATIQDLQWIAETK